MNNKYEYGYDNNQETENSESPLALVIHYLRIAKRHKYVIALISMIGMALTAYNVLEVVPSYSAETVIMVDTAKPNDIATGRRTNLHYYNLNLNSEIAVINSLPFIKKVVQKLKLADGPEEESKPGLFKKIIKYILGDAFKTEKQDEEPVGKDEVTQIIAEIIQENLEVQAINRTLLISIKYKDIDNFRAKEVTNAIAENYLLQHLDSRIKAADRATSWLSQRLAELQKKMRDSQRLVHEFKEQNNLLKSDGETLTDKQFKSVNDQLIAARTTLAENEIRYKQLSRVIEGSGGIKQLTEIVQSESLTRLREQYNEAAKQQADLVTRYSKKHPSVVSVSAQIRDINRQINVEAQRILNKAKNDMEFAKVRVGVLENDLAKNTAKTSLSKKVALRLNELEQEAEINSTIYQNFLTRFKEASEQKTLKFSQFRIVSKATLPKSHDGNKKRLQVGVIHLGATFVIAFAVVFLLEYRDNSFRTKQDTEKTLGIPYLGSSPLIGPNELVHGNKRIKIKDVVVEKSVSTFAQSLSSSFFKIKQLHNDRRAKVILLTSAIPNEGKTLIATSLARHIVNKGQSKVLAIDCDMRKASLSSHFYTDFPEHCLGDVLEKKANWKDVLCYDDKTSLEILPSILGDYNYLELLDSDEMGNIIKEARTMYDYIIIDTPPVTAVSDVHALTKHADVIAMVVEWGVTPREVVKEANKQLSGSSLVPRGFILNKVDLKHISDYEDYAYYGYGYGYGYGKA